jgi:CheY-like chemotaxis protein
MNEARILVVDDNATNLKLACDVLEWSGYQVSSAIDAEQAQQVIRQTPPDVIVMDIGLPGMDGLTLTRKLKGSEATRHIRIMALTAFAMKGDEEKVLEAGCDGYISKPINTREFAAQVARCLEEGEKS